MIEEFEYKGNWWLPDQPAHRVSGTLTFSPAKGIILELIGSLTDRGLTQSGQTPVILGISSHGDEITLHKCLEIQRSISFPKWAAEHISSFFAAEAYIGVHFEKPQDIKFASLNVNYSCLEEWVNASAFETKLDEGEWVIKYKPPQPIEATIDGDCKVSIVAQATVTSWAIAQNEAGIKQKMYIKIHPPMEMPFDAYRDIIYHVQNLLSLGIGQAVYPLAILGTSESQRREAEYAFYYPPVKVYYPERGRAIARTVFPFEMLFTLGDMFDSFDRFIKNWFKKVDMLKPVYDLYFGTLYNPQMYLDQRFLATVQAVESYHRRTMKNYDLLEQSHERRLREIADAVPEEHRKWLQNRLAYSNEPTLRARLNQVISLCSDIVKPTISAKKSFVNRVVDTRNYLTHYDGQLKNKAATGGKLSAITDGLKLLLEISLLKELGFESQDIHTLYSRNVLYKQRIATFSNAPALTRRKR